MRLVYNRKQGDAPNDAIYVGRPSKWGNPFQVGRDGTRDEVIEKYRNHLVEKIERNEIDLQELVDIAYMPLECWCYPKSCHADVLVEISQIVHDELENEAE